MTEQEKTNLEEFNKGMTYGLCFGMEAYVVDKNGNIRFLTERQLMEELLKETDHD